MTFLNGCSEAGKLLPKSVPFEVTWQVHVAAKGEVHLS